MIHDSSKLRVLSQLCRYAKWANDQNWPKVAIIKYAHELSILEDLLPEYIGVIRRLRRIVSTAIGDQPPVNFDLSSLNFLDISMRRLGADNGPYRKTKKNNQQTA